LLQAVQVVQDALVAWAAVAELVVYAAQLQLQVAVAHWKML
jgi:hypothetical protein